MISHELYSFFKSYQHWIDRGAPINYPYSRVCGLCGNILFSEWVDSHKELVYLFKGYGYPFGYKEYYDALKQQTQHLNPQRLTFVQYMINTYEEHTK